MCVTPIRDIITRRNPERVTITGSQVPHRTRGRGNASVGKVDRVRGGVVIADVDGGNAENELHFDQHTVATVLDRVDVEVIKAILSRGDDVLFVRNK